MSQIWLSPAEVRRRCRPSECRRTSVYPSQTDVNDVARIIELDAELGKFTKYRKEPRRSMRRVISGTVRALYPFQEGTMRKIRQDISRLNEILQQAASYILMYVYSFSS